MNEPIFSTLSGKPLGTYTCMKTTQFSPQINGGNPYFNYYCLTGCDSNPNCDVDYPVTCGAGGQFYGGHCCGQSGDCSGPNANGTFPELCDGAPENMTWSIECYNVSGCNGAYICG
jgi:hypothetical protein